MSSLRPSDSSAPIMFAHRGARADAPENTIEAFVLAKEMGASGMESDVWVTSDGIAVLDHDGVVGRGPRRKKITDLKRADLPAHIPSLSEYYETLGPSFELSLDLKDPAALDAMLAAARTADAESRLWICHPEVDYLATLRGQTTARLVDSTSLKRMSDGAERRAAHLAEAGIDVVNLRQREWSAGLVALFRRFGIMTFGWDAQRTGDLANLYNMGIDGVYSDHIDRMFATHRAFWPSEE